MVNVTVKIFGPLKDLLREEEILLSVPPPYTGETAFDLLAKEEPKLRRWKSSVKVAVNLEYAPFDQRLSEGDEICFLPPVSGG